MTLIKVKSAVILAAGHGRRMNTGGYYVASKPMVIVKGKPLISFIIDSLMEVGIYNITIVKRKDDNQIERIQSYYPERKIKFTFISDVLDNGSLNSFFHAKDSIHTPFMLVDSDIICNKLHFKEMLNKTESNHSSVEEIFGYVATIDNPVTDERMLKTKQGKAIGFNKKSFSDGVCGGMVYLFLKDPFVLCEEFRKQSNSYALFFNHLVTVENIKTMNIHTMWDVDTLDDIKFTEITLRERENVL